MPRLVDLGHRIRDGLPAYPGLPAARVRPWVTHADSRPRYEHRAEFTMTVLELAGNTGTYLDSPWHRYPEGADVADLPLEAVAALPGVVLDADFDADGRGARLPGEPGELAGCAVLIRTGWDRHWGTPAYWDGGPYLAAATLSALVDAGPRLVGVDFANVDDPADPTRPAHTRLLGAGIVVVEHLRGLDALPAHNFRFHSAPLAIERAASVPVRPYAELPDG